MAMRAPLAASHMMRRTDQVSRAPSHAHTNSATANADVAWAMPGAMYI